MKKFRSGKDGAAIESLQAEIAEKNALLAEKDRLFALKNADYMRSRREIKFMKPYFLEKVHERYAQTLNRLKTRVARGGDKIRVGFLVMHESVFPAKLLFEAMSRDPLFDAQIVLITIYTDYYGYSREQILEAYHLAYSELSKKYNRILKTYDPETDSYLDIADKFDIICAESPYMHFTHPYYLIDHLMTKDVLPIYVNYGYFMTKHIMLTVGTALYSSFWKVFADSYIFLEELKKYEDMKGANAVVTGYIRMDELALFKPEKRDRKRIIIAPHHASIPNAVDREDANFFRFADFFLKLPSLYPDIDFVFRPHPYAFNSYMMHKDWGPERVKKYFEKLKSYPNVIYSGSGEHLEILADSDGIIHDCGSFLCEYLFTGNPSLYILREKDAENLERYFNALGEAALGHCYKCFTEKDITDFIDNVIIRGRDPMKEERVKFVENNLKINYPFATQAALDHIKCELSIK